MGVRLYVGNLPYTTTDADLEELFSETGEVVSASVVTDRDTGRSRGFGFVEMANQEAADSAISTYNDASYQDRTLTVNVARPQAERGEGGQRQREAGGREGRSRTPYRR